MQKNFKKQLRFLKQKMKQTLEEKIKHCEDQIAINNIAVLYVTNGTDSMKSLQNSIRYYKQKLKTLRKKVV